MQIKIPEKIVSQFQEAIQPLKELIAKQPNAWLVGSIGAVILVNVLVILMPLLNSFFTTSSKMSVMKKEIVEVRRDRELEGQIKMEEQSADKALMEAEERLALGDISLYLEMLSAIASETGVKISSIQPQQQPVVARGQKQSGGPEKKEKVEEYKPAGFEISGVSGYHQIGRFVSKIENYKTFILIEDLMIRAQEEDPRSHLLRMKIRMIRKVEPEKKKNTK